MIMQTLFTNLISLLVKKTIAGENKEMLPTQDLLRYLH